MKLTPKASKPSNLPTRFFNRFITIWDKYVLEFFAGFLIVFIPLYPKWPLFEVLPGYIVRVRLEDFVIVFVLVIFTLQVIRQKASLKDNPLAIFIVAYLIIGLFSSLSALFITRTVPLEMKHVGKLFLHWGRRIEYMSLSFIFFSAIKNRASLVRLIFLTAITAALVVIYGFGQKYLLWPVYSTMNREFAKGWRLVLTEHARVPSTFAGHYDLAAFIVIFLSFFASLFLLLKNRILKVIFFILFLGLFSLLLLTASRTSFIAYLISLTILISLLTLLTRRWLWGLSRWFVLIAVSIFLMLSFGDLSQRFAHFLKIDLIKDYLKYEVLKLDQQPEYAHQLSLTKDLKYVYTESDTPPSRLPLGYQPSSQSTDSGAIAVLPPDVYENIPEAFPEATFSASEASRAGKPRTYSTTAFTFGLSSAIRFDALWPRALAAFQRSPLFGSGYSTLVKEQLTDFTEAESTDNDYLRALGETGLLGFLSFYAIILYALYLAIKKSRTVKEPLLLAVLTGISAGTSGLLINALYIDVFEASKVAYIFWALLGILAAIVSWKKFTPPSP